MGPRTKAGAVAVTMQPAIIIPAHNESAVIEHTLRVLLDGFAPEEVTVIVAANGCTDDTIAKARAVASWITVLDVHEPGKSGAIRAAEAQLGPGPRIYLDADIAMSAASAKAVFARLSAGAGGARPPAVVDVDGASWLGVLFTGLGADCPVCNKSFPVAVATGCRGKPDSASARSRMCWVTIFLPHE